jgi:hypothetical protein
MGRETYTNRLLVSQISHTVLITDKVLLFKIGRYVT